MSCFDDYHVNLQSFFCQVSAPHRIYGAGLEAYVLLRQVGDDQGGKPAVCCCLCEFIIFEQLAK